MPLVVLYFAFWRIIVKILVWIDLFSTLIWPKGPPFKIHKLRVVCRRMLRQSFVLNCNQNFIHRTHFSSQQMKTQINLIIQKLHILRDAFGIYAYMCVSFHSKHNCTAKALKIELKSTCLVKVFVIFRWCSSTTKMFEINNNIVRINGSESFSLFPSIQNILRRTKTICRCENALIFCFLYSQFEFVNWCRFGCVASTVFYGNRTQHTSASNRNISALVVGMSFQFHLFVFCRSS